MEEDGRNILSPLLSKPQIKKQLERLDLIAKEAQKRVDYSIAQDPEILKAIGVVERFLRKSGRVCYGGQAINALLPKGRKFYDPNYNIPDYDFFSPSSKEDCDDLIKDLESAGFADIFKKVGVHDGTTKLYVNFVPVADISEIAPQLYKIIHKRAVAVEGIMYCDPDFLKMMMYLELSRPRGEVSRWSKVFERLTLLNDTFRPKRCEDAIRNSHIDAEDRAMVLEFCIKHKCVVASPEFIELFEKGMGVTSFQSLVDRGGPVILFSGNAAVDGDDIKSMLTASGSGSRPGSRPGQGPVKAEKHKVAMDNIFNFVTVKRRGTPVALIFQEDACHSYTTLKLNGGDSLRVATPDLLLHLYYSLMIFGKKEKVYFETPLECLIQKIHAVAAAARNAPTEFLPAFGLRCSGRQMGIATLLREKQERTEKEKGAKKSRRTERSTERRRSNARRTRRSNLDHGSR